MIASVQLTDRELLREAVGDTWNKGYRRCLAHLAVLLPLIPPAILHQRLSLVGIYGSAVWAAWEAAMDLQIANRFWEPAYSVSNVLDTLQAMLEAPPSASTLALLAPSPAGSDQTSPPK
ncbi:hypothetical protein [Cupriavidus basilensis]|uniref:hypothetical protein n=1 Tax=Cupriavidus basilensis TaxID=68895 RepID=UPI00031BFDEA|nr:hypothetical protein [Cupriavidus basilensis]